MCPRHLPHSLTLRLVAFQRGVAFPFVIAQFVGLFGVRLPESGLGFKTPRRVVDPLATVAPASEAPDPTQHRADMKSPFTTIYTIAGPWSTFVFGGGGDAVTRTHGFDRGGRRRGDVGAVVVVLDVHELRAGLSVTWEAGRADECTEPMTTPFAQAPPFVMCDSPRHPPRCLRIGGGGRTGVGFAPGGGG